MIFSHWLTRRGESSTLNGSIVDFGKLLTTAILLIFLSYGINLPGLEVVVLRMSLKRNWIEQWLILLGILDFLMHLYIAWLHQFQTILSIEKSIRVPKKRRFKFENRWL